MKIAVVAAADLAAAIAVGLVETAVVAVEVEGVAEAMAQAVAAIANRGGNNLYSLIKSTLLWVDSLAVAYMLPPGVGLLPAGQPTCSHHGERELEISQVRCLHNYFRARNELITDTPIDNGVV